MDKLKKIQEDLIVLVQEQMTHSKDVDTKEFGEVVDMIKDLAEAMYYCTITEAMEEGSEHKEVSYYKEPKHYYSEYEPIRMKDYYFDPDKNDTDWDKYRRAEAKKIYTDTRRMHGGSGESMKKELEKYMQELSSDITDLVTGSTAEEKSMLKQKLMHLAEKIM